jgi:hypothetical protein
VDLAFAAVAETLAYEFGDLRNSVVVRVLTDCVDEFPYDGPHFIEQAARAQLTLLSHPGPPPQPQQVVSQRDPLDVSLHDRELHDEVELMGRLIVAANGSSARLSSEMVDELLGLSAPAHTGPVRVPRQATYPVR